MNMRGKSSGYTLLEVLLVLALLAGAGYLLLIRIPHHMPDSNLEKASSALLDDLRVTQQAAISCNTWYRVRFFPSAGRYMIFKESGLIRSVSLPEGVCFDNRQLDLTFSAAGTPGQGMSVILAAGNSRKKVIVAPVTGRIRMEDIKSN
jgi:prepilin-type N-terminal cleavage/methylation domain-containing protein